VANRPQGRARNGCLKCDLQIGAVAETVTVEAQAPTVDTASTSVSSVTAYGANTRDAYRASSADIGELPNLVAARPGWHLADYCCGQPAALVRRR